MTDKPERRNTPDRRTAARGGRRPYDKSGTAPLVLVVGDPQERESDCGMILSRLRFAVAPAADVAEAIRVIVSVNPDLIVARPGPADRLRQDPLISLPVIECDSDAEGGDVLVERIRKAIRKRRHTGV